MNAQSPWWYRLRGLVFGVIYGCGFFFGPLIWGLAGKPFESTPAWLAAIAGAQAGSAVFAAAVLCTFVCWALRAWGSAYLNADVVWKADAVTDALIVQGPFRYTRSPLYLGNIFMAAGVGALTTPCGLGIIVLGSIAFILMLVRYETHELRMRYGRLVDAYVQSVPALFWRLTPMTLEDSGRVVPSLAQGLRSEIFTACVFVAMLALWIFGNRAFPVFTVLLIGGWIAQFFATNRLEARAG